MKYQWLTRYIGKPYKLGSRGPDYFDCWGLLIAIFKNELNIDLPDFTSRSANPLQLESVFRESISHCFELNLIEQCSRPQDMDIFIARRKRAAHHAGLFISGGLLHISNDRRGVCFDRLINFSEAGYGELTFFRWNNGDN